MSDETATLEGVEDKGSAISIALENRDAQVRSDMEQALTDIIAKQGVGVVDKSRVLDQGEGGEVRHYGEAARTKPAWFNRYRTLPKWEQEVRSPEGDMISARFIKAFKEGDTAALREVMRADTEMRKQARADLLVGTITADSGLATGTAGPLVPLPLDNLLTAKLSQIAKLRNMCLFRTGGAMTLRHVVQNARTTVTWTAEATALTAGEPSYSDVLFTAQKQAVLMVLSTEAEEDSAFDLVSVVSNDAAGRMAEDEDEVFCNGTGGTPDVSANITSLLPAANALPLLTALEVTAQDILNLYFSVGQQYRRGMVQWGASDTVLAKLSGMQWATGGTQVLNTTDNALLAVEDIPGAIGTILGKPVVALPLAENPLATTVPDTNKLLFGNFEKAFGVYERRGITMRRSEDAGFTDDTVHLRFTARKDFQGLLPAGDVTDTPLQFFDDITSAA